MKNDETKKKRKRRKVDVNRILTPIVMILFVIALLMYLNLHAMRYALSSDQMDVVRATVVEKTVDPFTMVIPMVDLSYTYNGQEYQDKKYFVLEPFFQLQAIEGSTLVVYVNKKAPNHFMIQTKFYKNWINWLLLLFLFVFVVVLVRRCRWALQNRRDKKGEKQKKRENQSENEQIKPAQRQPERVSTEQTAEWRAAKQIVAEEQKKDSLSAWHIERRESDEQ